MGLVLRVVPWAFALVISAIFLDSLRFKFTGHQTPEHIFTTLREWSGIGLFFPTGPWIIGIAELIASILLVAAPLILLLVKRGRLADLSQAGGALIALGVMSGAIGFHLFTPLGIETPVEWAGDVATATSPALFIAACVSWCGALVILALRRDALRSS